MIPPNASNPAVDLHTRTWLLRLERETEVIDGPSRELVERGLDRVVPVSPAGLVYELALLLGAPYERAMDAGSYAELFYASCSLLDDIQDGDAETYLDDVPPEIRLNTVFMIQALAMSRLRPYPGEVAAYCYECAATMLTSQRLELLREAWDIAAYERVGRLAAGAELRALLRVAAAAAEEPFLPFEPVGDVLGEILQLANDRRSGDERLVCLPPDDIERYESELRRRAALCLEAVPDRARELLGSAMVWR